MILLDGPMGTELERRGLCTPAPGWSAYAIDEAPDLVRAVHADYRSAGALVHRTNTFRTQPHLFPDRWRTLLGTAVRLARAGAGTGSRIAGSIAPVSDCYRPDLSPPADEARKVHRAMAGAFAEEGIDLLVCETFPHAGEARIAVEEAVQTGVETWVALTAGPDGTLMTPEAMERAAQDCVRAGARAVLVCCTGARLTLPFVERLARTSVPFGAYANAGDSADALGGEPGAAGRYVAIVSSWLATGATIVGSCCGTGPAHVAALGELIARAAPQN